MNKGETKKVYLIDGSSYIYRAYHALTPLSNSKGMPTQAIYGVTNMLLKILREKNPEYMAVIWDAKGPTFRHKESPDYKANRPPMPDDLSRQIPFIKKIVDALGIASLEREGYEADDIIATLCKKLPQEVEIVIVSGDKDLQQLLCERIVMWDSMRNRIITEADIRKRYGLAPSRLREVMALTGDKIDNVAGVPGIGEKTALKLLRQFGSLDNLLRHLEEVKPERIKKNLLAFKEQVWLNLRLVSLEENVPLEISLSDLRLRPQKRETLRGLFEELDFNKLLKDLSLYSPLPQGRYETILSQNALVSLTDRLLQAKEFSLVVKDSQKSPREADIIGIAFCLSPGQAWYIPLGHFYLGMPKILNPHEVINALRPILENENQLKIGHDLKRSLIVLRRYGVELKGPFFDTLIGSYTLDPHQGELSVEGLAQKYLKVKSRYHLEDKTPLEQCPVSRLANQACEEADLILRAVPIIKEQINKGNFDTLFAQIEIPLIRVLADMEYWGVGIDKEYLGLLEREFLILLRQLEREIFDLAGEEFNINSPQKLRHILFERLKLPVIKKTRAKTGYSTDAEVLKALALLHPLPKAILRYRMLMKLYSGYITSLPKMINPSTGRIHTSYNQTVTITGRLSSSNPNLQNIPARGEEGLKIRRAFVPETGWYYLAADYSQIELRLLAHFSRDEGLLEAFKQGADIHTRTAAEIFNVSPQQVTPDMRRQAKVINFGIIYGMSAYGLSKELGITVKMAQNYIDSYFERYPGVKKYILELLNQARERGYVETLFKHKRYLPEIHSSNQNVRKAAERMAINTPIQGTAAEIIKKAMISLWEKIRQKGLQSKMIMQVHDELIFEAPPEELSLLESMVKVVMEGVVDLEVPLRVNIKTGKNWAEVS